MTCDRHLPVYDGAGCLVVRRVSFRRNAHVFYLTHYWFRFIFVVLLPCVVLIVVNALLIGAIRSANARRQQLLRTQRAVAVAAENDRTTLMLVVVVGIMIVVEFPMVVLYLLMLGLLAFTPLLALDSSLTMGPHTKATSKSCFYHIRSFRQIRSSMDHTMAITVASALVSSRLDYANSVLFGCPQKHAYSRHSLEL